MSSAESRLKPDHEIQPSHAAGVVRPAGCESKQGPNSRTASQAESLLAAEKRTRELMANGASLSVVVNDLCASIDAHASPVTSMVCLTDPDGKQLFPSAGPRVPAAFAAAIAPWPIGPNNGSCGTAAYTKQRVIIPDISMASINDLPIKKADRRYHWALGRRPDDHLALSDLGF